MNTTYPPPNNNYFVPPTTTWYDVPMQQQPPPPRPYRPRSRSAPPPRRLRSLPDSKVVANLAKILNTQKQVLASFKRTMNITKDITAAKKTTTPKTVAALPPDESVKADVDNGDGTKTVITEKVNVDGSISRKIYKRIRFESSVLPILDELLESVVNSMMKPFYLIYIFVLSFLCYDNYYSSGSYFIHFLTYLAKWPLLKPIVTYARPNLGKVFMILFTKSILLINRAEIAVALTSFTSFMVVLCRQAPAFVYFLEFISLVISVLLYRGTNKRKFIVIIMYAIPIIIHCIFYHFENSPADPPEADTEAEAAYYRKLNNSL